MLTVSSILLVVALVLFAIAAFGVAVQRFNLTAAGLCFVVLAQLAAHFMP